MSTTKLRGGTVHAIPVDLRQVLLERASIIDIWNDITPLARNEWICLIISAKKPETRTRRLERTRSQLANGQRRPCCWEGCPHRAKTSA